jgi:hypothetical protein
MGVTMRHVLASNPHPSKVPFMCSAVVACTLAVIEGRVLHVDLFGPGVCKD